MKVSELIEILQKLPQDVEVMKSSYDGCHECNPEGFTIYRCINGANYFPNEGEYPNREKNIVVI